MRLYVGDKFYDTDKKQIYTCKNVYNNDVEYFYYDVKDEEDFYRKLIEAARKEGEEINKNKIRDIFGLNRR